MTRKKKSRGDIGAVLRKINDQAALQPWAEYLVGVDPWKRLAISAESMRLRWAMSDQGWNFFSVADPRNAKVQDFSHEHGLIVFNVENGRATVEGILKGPLPPGYEAGGYVQCLATKLRHKGIGKYLLNAAERVISEKFTRIYLFVSETNLAAQRFYKSAGYQQIAQAHDCIQNGNTELLFTKALTS